METRHVGWNNSFYSSYYDPSVISWIAEAVMHKTLGVDQRPIRVTDRVIKDVLDSFLNTHRAFPGDIHTRYAIPGDGNFSGDFGTIMLRPDVASQSANNPSLVVKDNVGLSSNYILNDVVEFISENIRAEYEINTNNKRFSAWNALYGANDMGMRAHPQIKIREKRPTPFQFHMKF
jgi:hypothetical protein